MDHTTPPRARARRARRRSCGLAVTPTRLPEVHGLGGRVDPESSGKAQHRACRAASTRCRVCSPKPRCTRTTVPSRAWISIDSACALSAGESTSSTKPAGRASRLPSRSRRSRAAHAASVCRRIPVSPPARRSSAPRSPSAPAASRSPPAGRLQASAEEEPRPAVRRCAALARAGGPIRRARVFGQLADGSFFVADGRGGVDRFVLTP